MRPFAESFYKSTAWQQCRAAYAASVGGLCEDCLAKGLCTPGATVHHLQPLTPENITDPAVTLAFANLRLLCSDCHAARHKRQRRYRVEANGHAVAR